VASFLGRHGKKQRVLPAFRVVHPARPSQLPVDARGEVSGAFGPWQTHGAIMPTGHVSGKDASAPQQRCG